MNNLTIHRQSICLKIMSTFLPKTDFYLKVVIKLTLKQEFRQINTTINVSNKQKIHRFIHGYVT